MQKSGFLALASTSCWKLFMPSQRRLKPQCAHGSGPWQQPCPHMPHNYSLRCRRMVPGERVEDRSRMHTSPVGRR